MIKVLVISTSGFVKKEGISTILLDYFRKIDRENFRVDLVASGEYDEKLIREFENVGVKICFLPDRKKNLMRYLLSISKLMKKRKYNVLYINGSSALMTLELLVAKYRRIPKRVVHSHNTTCDHQRADKILRPFFYCLYTDALACGRDAGKWLFGNRSFTIIKNGRNIDEFLFSPERRNDMRKRLGVSENDILVGHVGNFNLQKNQSFLVSVFEQFHNERNNSFLFLMGEGEKKDEIQTLVEKKGLTEFVVFTGTVNNVNEYLQAMDIMVLPSLHEGLPLVVVEWQIASLPCLISDSVTSECAYRDYVTFLALDCGAEKWAEQIKTLLCLNRHELAKNSENSAKESGYDIDSNVHVLEGIFTR